MTRKRSQKKRTGISLAVAGALLFASWGTLGAAPKKKPALDTYAVVSGSVFTENGYALAGADVAIAPATQSSGGKTKPTELVSDARGEFVARVPPGPMHYNVTVGAKGYKSQQKTVSVEDQEWVEVTFQLDQQSK